MVAKAWRVLRC